MHLQKVPTDILQTFESLLAQIANEIARIAVRVYEMALKASLSCSFVLTMLALMRFLVGVPREEMTFQALLYWRFILAQFALKSLVAVSNRFVILQHRLCFAFDITLIAVEGAVLSMNAGNVFIQCRFSLRFTEFRFLRLRNVMQCI